MSTTTEKSAPTEPSAPPEMSEGFGIIPEIDPSDITDFYRIFRSGAADLTPEQNLCLAILDDAVHIMRRYAGSSTVRGHRMYKEARDWFLSDDIQTPYTFRNVCDYLGLDAQYFIKNLHIKSYEQPPETFYRSIRPQRGERGGAKQIG